MTIHQTLSVLESGGLIRLAALQPELEYAFQHALIQEAAYGTLVKANRRLLHAAVGESLEQLYPAQLASAELAPVLARHFAEGGDAARALHYYTLAGRAAAGKSANAEAAHHFGLALEMALRLAASDEAIVSLYQQRGHALELSAQDAQAVQNYKEMETWAVAHGNQPAQLAAMTARATIHVKPSVEQNLELGHALSQQALALARELGDRPAEAKVLWNLQQHATVVGQLPQSLDYAEQALRIARADGLREQVAQVLTDLWKVYFGLGRAAEAIAAVDEASAIWREAGVLNMLADNLATMSFLNVMAGHYPQAVALSDQARQVSRTIGNTWNESWSLYTVYMAHFERGDIGLALEVAEECRRLAQQAGFAEALNGTRFDMAGILAFMGALPQALAALAEFRAQVTAAAMYAESPLMAEAMLAQLQYAGGRAAEAQATLDRIPLTRHPDRLNHEFILLHQLISQTQAELALAGGQAQQALQLADDLIAHFERDGVRVLMTDALCLRGRALAAAGRADEAQTALTVARAEAEAVGSRRGLWPILAALAALAEARGEAKTALGLRQQAAETIDYIAEHAGAAELRESFMSRADVQATLRGTVSGKQKAEGPILPSKIGQKPAGRKTAGPRAKAGRSQRGRKK